MMRQLLVMGLVVGMMAPLSAAQSDVPVDQQQIEGALDEVLAELPGFAKSLVGDQRVNIYIHADENASIDENQTIGIEMEQMNITSWQDEAVANATFEVWVDGSVIEEALVADDRRSVLKDALENDRLRYEAHGLFNSILVGLVRALMMVLSVIKIG